MSELIDKCIEYIETKGCSYLAKEGLIVFFASDTGRKSDYEWKKQTVTETLRIIKALKLSHDKVLKDHHLISAFQELGRVYEYGVKSNRKVSLGVFNYQEHSMFNLNDEVVRLLAEELIQREWKALYLSQIMDLIIDSFLKLDIRTSHKEMRDLLSKNFEMLGYLVRVGSSRPRIRNKLTSVVMIKGLKPSDVKQIPTSEYQDILKCVYNRVK